MAKTRQAAKQQVPTMEIQALPDWLLKAHEHFFQTGFYRPEDVQRVIGSQLEGVEVRAEPGWCNASYANTPSDT
jgi:hypothetical protein